MVVFSRSLRHLRRFERVRILQLRREEANAPRYELPANIFSRLVVYWPGKVSDISKFMFLFFVFVPVAFFFSLILAENQRVVESTKPRSFGKSKLTLLSLLPARRPPKTTQVPPKRPLPAFNDSVRAVKRGRLAIGSLVAVLCITCYGPECNLIWTFTNLTFILNCVHGRCEFTFTRL